jgi:hypothetical protein
LKPPSAAEDADEVAAHAPSPLQAQVLTGAATFCGPKPQPPPPAPPPSVGLRSNRRCRLLLQRSSPAPSFPIGSGVVQLIANQLDQNLSRLSQPGSARLFRFSSTRLLKLGSTQRGSPTSALLRQQATNHADKASCTKGAFTKEGAIRAKSGTAVVH